MSLNEPYGSYKQHKAYPLNYNSFDAVEAFTAANKAEALRISTASAARRKEASAAAADAAGRFWGNPSTEVDYSNLTDYYHSQQPNRSEGRLDYRALSPTPAELRESMLEQVDESATLEQKREHIKQFVTGNFRLVPGIRTINFDNMDPARIEHLYKIIKTGRTGADKIGKILTFIRPYISGAFTGASSFLSSGVRHLTPSRWGSTPPRGRARSPGASAFSAVQEEDSKCPICQDSLIVGEEGFVQNSCKKLGHGLHAECLRRAMKANPNYKKECLQCGFRPLSPPPKRARHEGGTKFRKTHYKKRNIRTKKRRCGITKKYKNKNGKRTRSRRNK